MAAGDGARHGPGQRHVVVRGGGKVQRAQLVGRDVAVDDVGRRVHRPLAQARARVGGGLGEGGAQRDGRGVQAALLGEAAEGGERTLEEGRAAHGQRFPGERLALGGAHIAAPAPDAEEVNAHLEGAVGHERREPRRLRTVQRLHAHLLQQLAPHRLRGALSSLDLAAGKLPQQRQRLVRRALRHQHAPFPVLQHPHRHLARHGGGRNKKFGRGVQTHSSPAPAAAPEATAFSA